MNTESLNTVATVGSNMALKSFRVRLTDPEERSDFALMAADAAQYLAYADQTDTFGYRASLNDVSPYEGDIMLTFEAPITSDVEKRKFVNEMERLSRVQHVEVF